MMDAMLAVRKLWGRLYEISSLIKENDAELLKLWKILHDIMRREYMLKRSNLGTEERISQGRVSMTKHSEICVCKLLHSEIAYSLVKKNDEFTPIESYSAGKYLSNVWLTYI